MAPRRTYPYNLNKEAKGVSVPTKLVTDIREDRTSDDEDLELVARIACNDLKAFKKLYERYHRKLTAFLMRIVKRRDAVDELLNDTFLVIWQKANSYLGKSRVSTWIFGIAYNKAIKYYEKQSKLLEREEVLTGDPEDPKLNSELETMERQDKIFYAMNKLSNAQRAVVILTFYHGYSYTEISDIVDCPVNTVKTRMLSARQNLRKIIERQR